MIVRLYMHEQHLKFHLFGHLESGQQQSLSDPHSSGVFDDANVEDVSLVQGVVRLEERKGCRGIVGLVNLKRKKQS